MHAVVTRWRDETMAERTKYATRLNASNLDTLITYVQNKSDI